MTIVGGRGPDSFDAADGEHDAVDGGRGRDTATVDAGVDRVRAVERLF